MRRDSKPWRTLAAMNGPAQVEGRLQIHPEFLRWISCSLFDLSRPAVGVWLYSLMNKVVMFIIESDVEHTVDPCVMPAADCIQR